MDTTHLNSGLAKALHCLGHALAMLGRTVEICDESKERDPPEN